MRGFIGRHAFAIDSLLHRLHIAPSVCCLMADVTVGWGPDCLGFKDSPRIVRWFFRWFWNGRCYRCWGEGVHHMVYPREEDVPCEACGATGRA